MRSAHIAEWILRLVTTRGRAASTVGDLTERAATRGAAWFWSGVLRTAASLVWREVAEHPARVTGLALVGMTIHFAIDFLFAGLSGVAFFVAAYRSGNHLQLDSLGWRIWFFLPVLIGSLLIGRMLARWARGRELACCAVYAVLVLVYNVIPTLGDDSGLFAVLWVLIVPAGVVWGRSRRLGAMRSPTAAPY
jgi:hypothetical protein